MYSERQKPQARDCDWRQNSQEAHEAWPSAIDTVPGAQLTHTVEPCATASDQSNSLWFNTVGETAACIHKNSSSARNKAQL
jgi:hypothetical protein